MCTGRKSEEVAAAGEVAGQQTSQSAEGMENPVRKGRKSLNEYHSGNCPDFFKDDSEDEGTGEEGTPMAASSRKNPVGACPSCGTNIEDDGVAFFCPKCGDLSIYKSFFRDHGKALISRDEMRRLLCNREAKSTPIHLGAHRYGPPSVIRVHLKYDPYFGWHISR